MDILRFLLLVVGFLAAMVLGYLIGKNRMKPKGDIVFETYIDEEDHEEHVRCTFKLDMDVDEIIEEDYILFGVKKDKKAMDYYRKEKK